MLNLLITFILFGLIYMGIETCYDGTSHWSMGLAGGLSTMLGGFVASSLMIPYLAKTFIVALVIAMIEYNAGVVFNADYSIWDYREHKYNLHGQISLRFFVIWWLAVAPVILWLYPIMTSIKWI